MFCVECGAPNPDSARSCNCCGKSIADLTSGLGPGVSIIAPGAAPSSITGQAFGTIPSPGNSRLKWLASLTTVGLLVIAGFLISCNEQPGNSVNAQTPEFMMASIDSHGSIAEDDVRVARYRTLLDLLLSKVGDNLPAGNEKQKIGSMLVETQEQLENRGISESMLNMMEGMNQLLHFGRTDLLSEHLAVYIGFRSDLGLSHAQAIDMMRRLGPKTVHMLGVGQIRPDGAGGLFVESESGTIHITSDMLQ
jgi:hypothetical protein